MTNHCVSWAGQHRHQLSHGANCILFILSMLPCHLTISGPLCEHYANIYVYRWLHSTSTSQMRKSGYVLLILHLDSSISIIWTSSTTWTLSTNDYYSALPSFIATNTGIKLSGVPEVWPDPASPHLDPTVLLETLGQFHFILDCPSHNIDDSAWHVIDSDTLTCIYRPSTTALAGVPVGRMLVSHFSDVT
jgi:hypothetical protein